jgi:hypothetical protein
MPASADGPHWQAFGASTKGAAHRRRDLPNQDAFASWGDAATGAAVAVVSDGHGGALHPRSAIGSQLAVSLAIDTLREVVTLHQAPDASERTAALRQLTERWQAAARDHVKAHPLGQGDVEPLTDEQRRDLAADGTIAYGTTIVAVAATPAWLALLQIGDGDALAVDAAHHASRPLPDDPRQTHGQTLSLCHREAWREARTIAMAGADLPALVLLATDGYANSFASDADFLEIGRDYAALLADYPDQLRARLPSILDETSAEGSGDDITLAVVHRAAAVPSTGAPAGVSRLPARIRRLLDRLR